MIYKAVLHLLCPLHSYRVCDSNHSSSHASGNMPFWSMILCTDSFCSIRCGRCPLRYSSQWTFIISLFPLLISLCVVRDISPSIPSLAPVALTRTMNLVKRVAIIKKLETKEMYWYHFSIRPSSSCRQATYRVGTKSQGFLSQNDGKMPWFALTLVRPGFQRSES